MREYDERGDDLEPVAQFTQHTSLPADAQLMGLDRNTEEGALVAMAGSLSSAKLSHRIIAWLLLLSFAVPHLLALVQEIV
ncbi:MAG: hypothetical protein M3393_00405 [Actinomycetota bacterium]|jgi:hypothetical protein|nr:hypothetical protein [Actinomycetota bacterium]